MLELTEASRKHPVISGITGGLVGAGLGFQAGRVLPKSYRDTAAAVRESLKQAPIR
jgi:hypothetical protein